MREIITTGKTIEQALDEACGILGASRDEITYEIITMPRRKLFSFVPAKVKVSLQEEEFSVKELLMDREPEQEKPQQPAAEARQEPRRRNKKKKEPRPEAPREQAKAPERAPEPEKPAPRAPEKAPEPELPETEIPLDQLPVGAAAAFQYLCSIAEGLGAGDLSYRAVAIKDGVKFIIDGESASVLIGRRGETMDSLQYLCLLVSNRAGEDYCKITLDVAGYRGRREQALEALAQKVAKKVLKTRYSQTLEPMNPYERRIVHAAIQNIEGVKSESVGQNPNRRVVISLVSGGKESRRRDGRRREDRPREDRRREDRRREPREPREPRELDLAAAPREYQRIDAPTQRPATAKPEPAAPEKKEEAPRNLYQKIEL